MRATVIECADAYNCMCILLHVQHILIYSLYSQTGYLPGVTISLMRMIFKINKVPKIIMLGVLSQHCSQCFPKAPANYFTLKVFFSRCFVCRFLKILTTIIDFKQSTV